jgi:exopolysaccharide biosynthesis polyprenyl glycosylphosphotransferase
MSIGERVADPAEAMVAEAAVLPYDDAGTAHVPGRRGWLLRRALLLADVFGLTAAFLTATQLFPAPALHDSVGPSEERLVFLATLPLWVIVAKLHGLYDGDEECADHSTADDLLGVFHVVTVGTFMVMLAGWLTGRAHPTPPKLFTFWALAIIAVTGARAGCRLVVRRFPAYVQRTLVVGAGDVGQRVAQKILQHPEYGIELVGFVDDLPKERSDDLGDLTILGRVEELEDVVRKHGVDRVIVAFSNDRHEVTLGLLRMLAELDVRVDVVPRLFEAMGAKARMHAVEGLPLTALPRIRLSRSAQLAKRALDLAFSLVALVLLVPPGALVALAIKLDTPGPVLFRQTRMGAAGRAFRILKFRTMVVDADAHKSEIRGLNKHLHDGGDPRMFKAPGDPRITRVGGILRRWSLDELPQLLNVVRGEMSLVGPRPLILEEDEHVVDWRRRRLHVKPGITGVWQVLGRDGIPFEEMTVLDYDYVTSWSLLSDVQLMLRTLPAMVRARSTY